MSGPATGVAPDQSHRMRWVALALVVFIVAAAIILPLININRYHRRIAETLGRSVGRPVHLGSVQLQLLPRPGLAITDFVVEEDPGFGSEPLLRAPAVTVSLRLGSFWRQRLEVSSINLDNASVNLVRDARGRWNIGSLLLQAARTSNAPTAQRYADSEPRFPYIEFRSARINFKTGAEKKSFSFLNADLSIWLAQPDQWQLRFEAQPARTDLDLDLSDTGVMRLEGSVSRAVALDQIPVKLHAEWNKAPLGQVSRMLFGQDSGWRGLLRAEADFTGDIRTLQINARLRVNDAHRQEFTPLSPLNVDARCRAVYHRLVRSVDHLTCLWPVGDGHLLLTGGLKTPTQPEVNLTLEINRTPTSFAVSALGLLRRGLTPSLDASGLINGHFTYASGEFANRAGAPTLTGEAAVDSLSLRFPGVDKSVVFPVLHFATPAVASPSVHAKRRMSKHDTAPPAKPAREILLAPAPVELGAANPLELSGQFTADGFALHLAGQADLVRLTSLSKSSGLLGTSLTGLAPATAGPPATADLDVTIAGPWMTPVSSATPPPPSVTTAGMLRIEHAQAKLDWLPEPIEIASATANFSADRITWNNAVITVNGIAAHGSYSYPLPCDAAENCGPSGAGNFSLDIPTLDAAALESALVGAGRHGELLSEILSQVERKAAPWPSLDGAFHVATLTVGSLALHDARGMLQVKENRMDITSLDAGALGGSINVAGSVENAGNHPVYSLKLNWTGISIPQVAAVFHEKWGAGTVNGNADLTLEGYAAPDLAASARGAFHWDWSRGSIGSGAPLTAEGSQASVEQASLTSIKEAKFSPVHFSRWLATGTIADKTLKLDSPDRTNPVTGTVSFDRELDLSWPTADDATVRIGGTLAHPTIDSSPPSRQQ
jgi:AsmA family/AsmA-like C-terminal region